jgi:hypothetical protein
MRAALIAMMILLIPAALFAVPMMGVYFTYSGGQMYYNPMPTEEFYGYVYSQGSDCYLNAAEFALELPPGIALIGYTVPDGALQLGSLPAGISLAFFPPMDGFTQSNLLATLHFFAVDWCDASGGTMVDTPLRVIPHPDTGLIQGSCFPENYLFQYVGLTSTLCPLTVGVQETNWGAIKSLF